MQIPANNRRAVMRPTVLIVEDQSSNRRLLEHWLNKLGFAVESADDGLAALKLLSGPQSEGCRLVLMDCCLPSLSGLEVTRQLRAWEVANARRPLPVVGLSSASADEFSRENCLAAGMDDFVPKPLNLPELGIIILRLLQD